MHREEKAERAKQGLGGWFVRPAAKWFEETAIEELEAGTGIAAAAAVASLPCEKHAEGEGQNGNPRSEVPNSEAEPEAGEDAASLAVHGSTLDGVHAAEQAERAAMEGSGLGDGGIGARAMQTGGVEAKGATAGATLSNKERKRRRKRSGSG